MLLLLLLFCFIVGGGGRRKQIPVCTKIPVLLRYQKSMKISDWITKIKANRIHFLGENPPYFL
jgi:hypothetical protein